LIDSLTQTGFELFAHTREQVRELDPPKYPALSEEQQKQRTPEEFAAYERERAAEEQERRTLQFRYREFTFATLGLFVVGGVTSGAAAVGGTRTGNFRSTCPALYCL
jgi:hypothetical protein